MRYYAIGDLHGRHDLLEKCFEKISGHVGENEFKVITLGDYIDRGPKSRQVIDFLMTHQQTSNHPEDLVCLQGNHESICVQTVSTGMDPSWWVGNGGDKTLESYGHPKIRIGRYGNDVYTSIMMYDRAAEHVKWMAGLPLYYETEKQVFVHAGIPNDANLAEQQFDTRADGAIKFQWMLYGPSDHGGWRGKHVVHGHHQFADGPHTWHPGSEGGGRTDLDTYAWKTGRIVIGVFDDTQGPAIEFIEVTDVDPDLREDGSSLDTGKAQRMD